MISLQDINQFNLLDLKSSPNDFFDHINVVANELPQRFGDISDFNSTYHTEIVNFLREFQNRTIDKRSVESSMKKYNNYDIPTCRVPDEEKNNRLKKKVVLATSLVRLILRSSESRAFFVPDWQLFTQDYPEIAKKITINERSSIVEFRNYVNLLIKIFNPDRNKNFFFAIIERLEGGHKQYKFGGGQTFSVTCRVDIYRTEGNVSMRKSAGNSRNFGSILSSEDYSSYNENSSMKKKKLNCSEFIDQQISLYEEYNMTHAFKKQQLVDTPKAEVYVPPTNTNIDTFNTPSDVQNFVQNIPYNMYNSYPSNFTTQESTFNSQDSFANYNQYSGSDSAGVYDNNNNLDYFSDLFDPFDQETELTILQALLHENELIEASNNFQFDDELSDQKKRQFEINDGLFEVLEVEDVGQNLADEA